MLTVNECKQILGTDADGVTEDDIIQIREWLSILADIAIDSMEKNDAEKNKPL
jgi:hypothetical protein